jgi:hypothetical protein
MDAVGSLETLVTLYRIKWYHKSEDHNNALALLTLLCDNVWYFDYLFMLFQLQGFFHQMNWENGHALLADKDLEESRCCLYQHLHAGIKENHETAWPKFEHIYKC